MKNLRHVLSMTVCLVVLIMAGCARSSHKTVRTYDYSDDSRDGRRTAHQPVDSERETHEGDYEMVPPGEMRSPGEMVPPGRPVVGPR